MMDWFTADTHFGHRNIIRRCQRPFADESEMDRCLLDNINAVVAPRDTLYHLGDFAWRPEGIAGYRAQIRCRNVILILGNHDPQTKDGQPKEQLSGIFSRVYVRLRIRPRVSGVRQTVVLQHNALRTWDGSHRGAWNLFGHSHGKLDGSPASKFEVYARTLDVGVDVHDYRPISLPEVAEAIGIQEAGYGCGR